MIKQIVLLDFRGHSKTLNFGAGLNKLRGPNESGKSTVKEAIAFVWQGTDSGGSKSPDHLISEGKDAMEVMIVTEHAKISRRKRKGQTSAIKLERHGFPPVTMTQTELSALLKLSNESFMCCWNAGYFMSMQSSAQLAVLAELAKVDRRALLMSMLPEGTVIPAKVKLINPKIDADAIAGDRRQVQNVKASDEGALSQVKAQLESLKGTDSIDIESHSKSLNDLNAKLAAWDFYKQALGKYQTEKMRWGEAINRKGGAEAGLMGIRLRGPEEMEALKVTFDKNRRKYEDIRVSLKTLKDKAKPMPAAPKKPNDLYLEADAICDKCGQKIDQIHVKKIMGHYEATLLEYNKEAREVQTHNDRIKLAVEKGELAMRDIDMENTQLSNQMEAIDRVNRDMLSHKAKLEQELAEVAKIKEPAAPEKPEGDEESLRRWQLETNTELNVARRQQTQLTQLRKEQDMLAEAIGKKDAQILHHTALEKALKALPVEEAKKLIETIEVSGVEVTLDEGNLYIMAGKIPYASLSSGKKMKVDLAFCQSLRRAGGARAPVWIFSDNSDLIDVFPTLAEGLQVFSAEVDKNLKELQVITYGE